MKHIQGQRVLKTLVVLPFVMVVVADLVVSLGIMARFVLTERQFKETLKHHKIACVEFNENKNMIISTNDDCCKSSHNEISTKHHNSALRSCG